MDDVNPRGPANQGKSPGVAEPGNASRLPNTLEPPMPAKNKDCANVIAFPPLVFAVILLAGMALQFVWPLPLFHRHPSRWIGGVLAIGSAALAKWGEMALQRAGTHVNPSQPTIAIVQNGPFRFSRNPLYLSLMMLYVGVSLMFNALMPVLLFPLLVVVVHFGIVRREERYLETKFGDPYRRYQQKVRR